jgi:hypothetical protein
MTFEKARDPFAAGLALIRRSLPPPGKDDANVRKIRSLMAFHDRRVAWGEELELKADGSRTIVMETEPANPAATIVVVTSGRVHEGFNVRAEGTRLWIYEYPTTSAWGALIILHELSHLELASRSTRAQTDDEWIADELVAYELELAAADLISKGRVSRVLSEAAREIQARDPDGFFREYQARTVERHNEIQASLQEAMGSRGPKSDVESGLRGGFEMSAIGIVRFRPDRAKLMGWMRALSRAHAPEDVRERLNSDTPTPAPPPKKPTGR